ncbi:hypothetical protein FBEOM_5885 [Fusarium beomiforme]|uniref:NAD-dependent epimerase/dehydratase domain-containing protein n=1 Tax=Fusarium beomiforme TaxID=44412 RepID=A0A9P5AK64_9HYPO|nr:hypothetical protein FBEOM_5885 [Fusarium beomiforme]
MSGWPSTVNKDTDAIFETEKQLVDYFPVRKHAEAVGVTTFVVVVVPPVVYGRGTGPWNQLSVHTPDFVHARFKHKKVYKFEENTSIQTVHISDLTALYSPIVRAALNNEDILSGKEGYYFAVAHDVDMWEFQDHFAAAMEARGLVPNDKPDVYPVNEFAAEAVEVPGEFLNVLYQMGDTTTESWLET